MIAGEEPMVIELTPQLAVALGEQAKRRGVSPENLALEAEHKAWMRKLSEAASDCGVSLSNEALSSEGLYD
jgi:hypothetical protein